MLMALMQTLAKSSKLPVAVEHCDIIPRDVNDIVDDIPRGVVGCAEDPCKQDCETALGGLGVALPGRLLRPLALSFHAGACVRVASKMFGILELESRRGPDPASPVLLSPVFIACRVSTTAVYTSVAEDEDSPSRLC